MSSRRILATAVLPAAVVVVAAGMSGTAHFSGLRWVPHIHTPPAKPTRLRVPPTAPTHATKLSHGNTNFPIWILYVVAVVVVVFVIAWLLWRWWANRTSRAALTRNAPVVTTTRAIEPQPEPEPEPEPDMPVLRSGIELALATLDGARDPADAIVRAWLGLQETAESSGIIRGAAETPSEFTARILGRAFADDRALKTLLRLYLRTRFGDHPVTASDVASVRVALEELVAGWPTPVQS